MLPTGDRDHDAAPDLEFRTLQTRESRRSWNSPAVAMRYHCPMSRTVSIWAHHRNAWRRRKGRVEAFNTAIDMMKPGHHLRSRCTPPGSVVQPSWHRERIPHGLFHRPELSPDWGEHTLSIRPGDTTELQPGMTRACDARNLARRLGD
jgi:Xaa-Pro aminopeptidase